MIKGVDISQYQGNPDFTTLKQNIDFAIIRSSYGDGYIDPKFNYNVGEARRVQLAHGFYHYAYPQYNQPQAEADWFAKVIGTPQKGELLCLDFEENFSGDTVAWCKSFLDHLSDTYGGYKPLIYLNNNLLNTYNWKPVIDAGYGLWLALWDYNPDNLNFNTPWPFVAIRQYTNKLLVAGIVGNVDGNVFYGDVATFNKYGYNGVITPVPEPSFPDLVTKSTNWDQIGTAMKVDLLDKNGGQVAVQKYTDLQTQLTVCGQESGKKDVVISNLTSYLTKIGQNVDVVYSTPEDAPKIILAITELKKKLLECQNQLPSQPTPQPTASWWERLKKYLKGNFT